MLIAEFARVTGLSRDTIRFYVKRGLLKPAFGPGQTNRYQHFDQRQVERAALIRTAQSLGFTLAEITALDVEYALRGMTLQRKVAVMTGRIAQIDEKMTALREVRRYFVRKRAWRETGVRGEDPPAVAARPRRVARGAA